MNMLCGREVAGVLSGDDTNMFKECRVDLTGDDAAEVAIFADWLIGSRGGS